MTRTIAKYLVLTLLVLASSTPCPAAQDLEACSIGGFTWNLTEPSRQTENRPRESNLFDRIPIADLQRAARKFSALATHNFTPIATGVAESVFRTAKWTSQHSRFPIRTSNPLRWKGDDRQSTPGGHLEFHSACPRQTFQQKACPQQMDSYWKYYSDCDRWNIVFAEFELNRDVARVKPPLFSLEKMAFRPIARAILDMAGLKIWRVLGERNLSSIDPFLAADKLVVAARKIQFHALDSTFAKAMVESANGVLASEIENSLRTN